MGFHVKDINTLIYNPRINLICHESVNDLFLKLWIFLIKVQNVLFYLPAKVVVAKKNPKAIAYFWQAKIISCGCLDLTMWPQEENHMDFTMRSNTARATWQPECTHFECKVLYKIQTLSTNWTRKQPIDPARGSASQRWKKRCKHRWSCDRRYWIHFLC